MKKILVTGAGGQLGQELRFFSRMSDEFELLLTRKEDLDITDGKAVDQYIRLHRPDYCINTAAYTQVDRAEEDRERARLVNITGAENIAKACDTYDTILFHFSTDYVYHTRHNWPFMEDDQTAPKSVYAKSKLEGELRVREICEKSVVLRTSWVYSSYGLNFIKTMIRLAKERKSVHVVFDQIGCPTYARDLSNTVLDIIRYFEDEPNKVLKKCGLYHYSNEGVCSWYDLAVAIFDIKGIPCKVHPIRSGQYPTAAARPYYSVLDKEKIKNAFEIEIPHWRSALERCLKLMPRH